MPITIETSDPEKSILFIVGETNPLIPSLVEEYKKDFKIAIVSQLVKVAPEPGVFNVNPANAELVKNLKEKIEYAIVFLDEIKMKDYIGPIFEKFAQDETKCAVVCGIEKIGEFVDVAKAAKAVPHFYFLFEGDAYSEITGFNKSKISELIDNAVHEKHVVLSGNDLAPIFPIYYKDAIAGITQILLGPTKRKKYYNLFYEHPQTYISAIHEIERVEPDLKVTYESDNPADKFADFKVFEKEIEEAFGEKSVFINLPEDGFEKSLQHFIARGPIKVEEEKTSIINAPGRAVKSQSRKLKFSTTAFLVAFILFVVIQIFSAFGSVFLFRNSIQDFKKGNYKNAATDAKTSKTLLTLVDPTVRIVAASSEKLDMPKIAADYKLYSQAVEMTSTASRDSQNLTKIGDGITGEALNQSIADAVWLYFAGQKLKFETANPQLNAYLTPEMSRVLSLAQIAPQVLGFNGKKRYLLLFQNNGELRPTGGFIGSVGELTVINGRIEDLTLEDVYEHDGQLKVHIEPSAIVRRYLQPNLYLRDSNFDPDFQNSASTSALIYNLETGRKVDGVIAVNFDAVKEIIGAIGPIDLATYKKTLTRDNTFDFLQSTIDNNFFPGSTAKRDVLQALFDKIMLKLESPNEVVKVARLIPTLAAQKNILFAFNQGSVQSAFSSVGFAGEYKDMRDISVGSVNDFLGVNEANIGVNKANIDISRSTSYTATITGTRVLSKITHIINNKGDKGYNVYIRFLVPLGSKLTSVKIDGANQTIIPAITEPKVYEKKGFIAPTDLEVAEEVVDGKTSFGFRTLVEPKTDQTIEVEYDNGITVPASSLISYSLLLIKQPGTSAFPFALNLIYGKTFTPKSVTGARLENGVIIIDRKVDGDVELKVDLLRR